MTYDVLIVGAGLAGLKAARDLQATGRRVLVLDKGRGVGGRAATRRWDGVPVDHGAQFFTARSDEFRAQVADWVARGVCFEWAKGFHQWDDDGRGVREPDPKQDSHPRYACHAGMSALCKDLAAGLAGGTVRLETRVTAVRRAGAGDWQAAVEGTEEIFAARHVLLTLPAPQALALFEGDALDAAARHALESVGTDPSIAVMLRGEAPAPDWKAIQMRDAAVTWLAVDSSKREGQTGGRIFVMHGSGPFSREWQDTDLDEGAQRMVDRVGEIVGDWITRLPDRQVSRWRYASVSHGLKDRPFLRAEGGLYFAGDGFMEAKLEGAYRSGQEAARALLAETGA